MQNELSINHLSRPTHQEGPCMQDDQETKSYQTFLVVIDRPGLDHLPHQPHQIFDLTQYMKLISHQRLTKPLE